MVKSNRMAARHSLRFHPLTSARWPAFEKLFGPRGACAGCWCMFWRLKRSVFIQQKGEGNRRAIQRLVKAGDVPGILAFAGKEAVGWCAVSPRETYSALERSRAMLGAIGCRQRKLAAGQI